MYFDISLFCPIIIFIIIYLVGIYIIKKIIFFLIPRPYIDTSYDEDHDEIDLYDEDDDEDFNKSCNINSSPIKYNNSSYNFLKGGKFK